MAKQTLNLGVVVNDGLGEGLRSGGTKLNANFDEIYASIGDGTNLTTVGAGDIVGTTGTQTLSNKTINSSNNTLTVLTSDLSGTLNDATVAESNVTQHQAAISVTESQISDLGSYITGASPVVTTPTLTLKQSLTPVPTAEGDIQWDTDNDQIKVGDGTGTKTFSADADLALGAGQITSGTFTDARVAQSNVTQHQAALTITESQISDLGAYITDLTAENIETLSNVVVTAVADNEVMAYDSTGGNWINQTAAEAGLATATHTHVEADITDLGAYIENVLEDTTPQLGGMLDVNGNALGDGTRELLTFTEDASAVNHVNIENQATGSGPILSAAGDDTNVDLVLSGKGTGVVKGHREFVTLALSDLTTALTTGTSKAYWRAPYALTVLEVRASVLTAPTGSGVTVDINEGGVSILSTKLSIDATEKTSTTAATAAVISDSAIADDAEVTFDIDAVGSTIAGAGLQVTIIFEAS